MPTLHKKDVRMEQALRTGLTQVHAAVTGIPPSFFEGIEDSGDFKNDLSEIAYFEMRYGKTSIPSLT